MASMRRACLTLGIIASALTTTTYVAAQPVATDAPRAHTASKDGGGESAVELNDRGEALYLEGRYEEAASLFHRAYELDPNPTLLYNEALALEKAKRYREALSTLQAYLEKDPDVADRPAIEARIGTLKALVDKLDEKPPPPPPEPDKPTEESGMSWLRGPTPWLVAGLGASGIVVGAVLGVVATNRQEQAQATAVHLDAVAVQNEAEALATGSTVGFIAGGVLLAAGTTLAVIGLATDDEAETSLVVAPTGLSLRGTF